MPRTTARPVVFIGSSTGSLRIAEEVRRFVRSSAHVHFWRSAFDPGKWTLRAILDYAQQSDFGVFVIAPDDNSMIRDEKQWIVRDNVLFEAGIFMGALGPEGTFLPLAIEHCGPCDSLRICWA